MVKIVYKMIYFFEKIKPFRKLSLFIAIVLRLTTDLVSGDPFQWTVTGTRLPFPITGQSVLFVGNDSIYMIGGSNGSSYNDQVFRYSISTGSLEVNGRFVPVVWGAAALVEIGRAHV